MLAFFLSARHISVLQVDSCLTEKSNSSTCYRRVLKGSKVMNLVTNTALDNILIIGHVLTNV